MVVSGYYSFHVRGTFYGEGCLDARNQVSSIYKVLRPGVGSFGYVTSKSGCGGSSGGLNAKFKLARCLSEGLLMVSLEALKIRTFRENRDYTTLDRSFEVIHKPSM